ncbi:MAG: DNA polymerase III subunit delta [Firmicutes bacterium]|nr:DNA polymerase III subunit delta [Bacillota bacterium]
MDIAEAMAVAERGTLEKVYYIIGQEPYWAWQWIFKVRDRLLGDRAARDGYLAVDESSVTWPDVKGFLQTPSLFSQGRVVLVRDTAAWKSKESDVMAWLPIALDATCLIIWDKKSMPGLVKGLGSTRVIELKPLKPAIFMRFVESSAKKRRLKLKSGAAELLVQMVDANEYQVEQELDKMALYDAQTPWDEALVRDFVAPLGSTAFWKLSDLVVRRQKRDSLQTLQELLIQGNEPLPILITVARQLIQVGHVLEAQRRGISAPAFAQQEGLKDFVASRLYQSAKGWTLEQVSEGIRRAQYIDRAIKIGRGDPEVWLTLWLALM